MPYDRLLAPLTIGGITLPNRVVMGSMHTGMEDRAKHFGELAEYFAERARGGTGLMITGGFAPDTTGWLLPAGSQLTSSRAADKHRVITDAVHEAGGRIALQILHAGRYGYHPLVKSASAVKSPISRFKPRAMSGRDVERTIGHYARAARLAMQAGYDGVEIMGSEGYLINQFLTARSNGRTDQWGGSASNRMRFPEQVVRRVRESVGEGFLLIYRQSLLDLVPDGQSWEETVELAQRVEQAGASVINTGIGWHEARIPTIVTSVPRAAFASVTGTLREHVTVPVMASNRINTPEVAEQILADGQADLISMARPLLADPQFVRKAEQDRADEINTCIACNQACLDHTFKNQRASCLVNPRAGRETTLRLLPVGPHAARTVAVVGAGPAGLAAAVASAERGHRVTLFEEQDEIGGQFRYAMRIPGKEEFAETLRYYTRRMQVLGVEVRTGTRVDDDRLAAYDHTVVATGVTPRVPPIPGIEHPKVVMYDDLLSGRATAGARVAVIGAGGIGFDVSEYLLHDRDETVEHWKARWGVTDPQESRAGLGPKHDEPPKRTIHLLQRRPAPLGKGLGKTSGWVHRQTLKDGGVEFIGGVTYDLIDDEGLHITIRSGDGKEPDAEADSEQRLLQVDTVVICAGQESVRDLARPDDPSRHLVGGADVAAEVDAKRAIRQATELAASL
ncbi:NADPH-dependent 2,4-dienoyl-CoA reductase [Allobranchiibius sp. GilTou73]|uniref:NADPH-dependent 2,4-dienoyl-CoA reductase n=1 Tax=Allobranchiibius sp. GilTou73 TaxID=2904523 RepID=UPI001F3D968A|nr:NADPH-dependent 2,4-dienoyl-CoA reductase [Allobranchiibius sp. GilTou73]UIJ34934.1 NADPH-dependent 2,4-dienoyl-CoA reductase [Allobranchiibius sp. GilTou73]